MRAEKEIARLEQRQLAPEQLREETLAICDRAVRVTREVREHMQRRALAAKRMQDRVNDIFRQRSRFANLIPKIRVYVSTSWGFWSAWKRPGL